MLKMIFFLYYCICSLLFFISFVNSSNTSCSPDDRKVLLQIKQHFNNVYPFSEWNPETDCCSWKQLACDDPQAPGRVSYFLLYNDDNVSGEIPEILGDLPFLNTLDILDVPKLTGPIPSSFTKLTRLGELSIGLTSMNGPIPDFLSQIKSLAKLQLFASQFSGSIPSSLSLLPKLSIVDLSGNQLSGEIPASFGSFKTNLTLKLNGNNDISGEIPKSLGKVNITSLDLSYNKLNGDASFLFGKDKPLFEVILRINRLKFNFSKVEFPLGLTYMDIAYNEIYGSLPRQLGQMHNWKYLNVSYNQLCGKIPKGRRLKSFSPSAFAHNKCLCGAHGLPSCK